VSRGVIIDVFPQTPLVQVDAVALDPASSLLFYLCFNPPLSTALSVFMFFLVAKTC
jgi:hypothetical protein